MLHYWARLQTLRRFGIMLLSFNAAAQTIPSTISVSAKVSTGAVKGDADDPAIWIHPTTPTKSVVIGTDKDASGGLYVWDMAGKQIQYLALGRPNIVWKTTAKARSRARTCEP